MSSAYLRNKFKYEYEELVQFKQMLYISRILNNMNWKEFAEAILDTAGQYLLRSFINKKVNEIAARPEIRDRGILNACILFPP